MSDHVLHLLETLVLCVTIVLFGAYLCLTWAEAAEVPEEYKTDYAAVMQECALYGDVETGRDAARRRDEKIDALGLDYPKVAFDELYLLSKIITAEAGSAWLPREWKLSVGEVVLNRVASPEFPDTVEEVLLQPGQYYGANSHYFKRLLPFDDGVEAAWALLNGERVLCDPSIVFQANFPQGSGTAVKYYDKLLGSTYFCYSAKPWLYE